MKTILLTITALLVLNGCDKKSDQFIPRLDSWQAFQGKQEPDNAIPTFRILTPENEPIEHAQVLIGDALNAPFEGNFLESNENGDIELPQTFSNQPVTISAPGFIRATFYGQDSNSHTYQLRRADTPTLIELAGVTTQFGNLTKDGMADFGLVIPALTRSDIFSFDMSLILSPEYDKFEVAGNEAEVPSNFTFPTQKENYFIPITLSKEPYRIYFSSTGLKKVYAIHGKFNFKTVIGKLRNGSDFADMINDFQYVSSSVRDLNITGNTRVDLPVNENVFGNPVQITAPSFSNDKVLVTLTVSDNNGYLLPSDLKRLEPNQTLSLKTSNLGQQYFVAVIKPSADFYADTPKNGPLSAVLVPLKSGKVPEPIDLFNLPSVSTNSWSAIAPTSKGNMNPIATYAVLSKIIKFNGRDAKYRTWEAYALKWTPSMKLPEFPGDIQDTSPHKWEISYLGNDSISAVNFGPGILNSATHVSYNVKDF